MTETTRRKKWRWWWHVTWVVALVITLSAVGVVIFFGSGSGNPIIRRYIVYRLEAATGTRVELEKISIGWFSLRLTLSGLVLHGKEPASTEPLFAADEVRVGLRVDSFWGRRVSLDDLSVRRPQVHIRIEKNGSSNLPVIETARGRKPGDKALFDLRVRKVRLEDGWLLYNDVRTPLAVEGGDLHFALDASGTAARPLYLGMLDWKSILFTAKTFYPAPVSVSAKFTLRPDGFSLEQGVVEAEHSHLDAQAEMQDFLSPAWTFKYRGWVNLVDLRYTLRSPETPTGRADIRGEGTLANGKFRSTGTYSGRDVELSYQPIFHAAGVSSRGSFQMDNDGFVVPDFLAEAFGGTVKGQMRMQFKGLEFSAKTHIQDMHLARVLPSIDHDGFPADRLHWDGMLSADSTETWSGPFAHFKIAAKMHWESPDELAAAHIPVDGDWDFRYQYDGEILDIASGEFDTPSTHGTISGLLSTRKTALDLKFDTGALESERDFVNAIRGAAPGSADEIKVLSGSAKWDGTISGTSATTFAGHIRGEQVRYENVTLDYLDGDLTYSPTELALTKAHIQHGATKADGNLTLALTDWSFGPDNQWSADANLDATSVDSIQQTFGWSYPVHGQLSGQFHGKGTRRNPAVSGLFDLADANAYGMEFNRLRGQLNFSGDEVRIADAELRIFAPGKEIGRGAGIITGTVGYNFVGRSITADLVGASLPLEDFGKLQTTTLPVGGQVSFRLKANGPLVAPRGDGTFRVVNLRIGSTVIGSFDGSLNSDGYSAKLGLGSAMTTGEISGGITVGLAEPFPLDGKVTIKNIDLDPFLLAALHLKDLNGHGQADGEIAVKGDLKHLDGVTADAQFSRLVLNYANVRLENSGPVHFRWSKEEIQIEPATFQGTDTNFKVDGSVHFSGRKALSLRVNGAVDLRLLAGIFPGLSASGSAQMNSSFEGTLDSPRITGRIHIDSASARMADFPTGLSAIKGDFIFDATRLFFDNLTAEAGGGTLHMAGSVTYSERPLRYDITARTDKVRIRYPEGMSWLAAGTLRLTGTTDAGLLAGRVTVERVTLTQGLEVAGVLVSTKEGISGPSTSSPFLRNLQFDIEAVSTPDARMQWPGAELEAEANLRVRGTWEHPILLGHIHVLSGDLLFHGNRYRVARGDINFANPFRLDPVVNVEASTTIQQYEITLNFNGAASKLTLAYRSDPPLPANDIVTLLALGQTSSEATVRSGGTGQASGGSVGASAILSEAVSSQLGGRLEKLFGITSLRVDPGLATVGTTGSEQNAAARVTVQQQVTRNLTVTYVSNVGSTQQQVIQVEYNVNRNVSVVALRDQNGTFGIDVIIKKRFP
ncbi:MAG TPA: translocation/assembly module TamB domain-containing protein [Candidatus Acidoferrum sp.]|jgi:translocation and assembly module TamB